jgi:hypothetical protein
VLCGKGKEKASLKFLLMKIEIGDYWDEEYERYQLEEFIKRRLIRLEACWKPAKPLPEFASRISQQRAKGGLNETL